VDGNEDEEKRLSKMLPWSSVIEPSPLAIMRSVGKQSPTAIKLQNYLHGLGGDLKL
jgi:hypothetical protein